MLETLLRLEKLAAVVAGVACEVGQAGLHAIDARLDHAGRMGDALGLAIDHRHDLGNFADRLADLAEAGLGGAAALDAGLDLGRDGACLAGQLTDRRGDLAGRGARVVRELLHFGGDDREAAARIAGARGLDGRVEGQHVGLAGDGLDGRGNGLHLVHRGCEAGHALAELHDEVGQPLEAGDGAVDGFAARFELGASLLGKQTGFIGGIGNARLVGEKSGRHFLELVEHAHMLGDARADVADVAGDVAAFHRQGATVSRDATDRVFRDFLDTLCGHGPARSRNASSAGIEASPYSFVNYVRAMR